MNLIEINNRIDLLRNVFAYSLSHPRNLNVGQRICLTQERTSLLVCIDDLNFDFEKQATPKYCIPDNLERKLQSIKTKIEKTNWVKPPYEAPF